MYATFPAKAEYDSITVQEILLPVFRQVRKQDLNLFTR